MSKKTGITWTDHTWNPREGCSRTKTWKDPERWEQEARRGGKIENVFTCSLSDFFHEGADAWRMEAWEVIKRCPHLQFQILTKKPLRIMECLPPDWGAGYPNVWFGVSIEKNDCAWRADVLRQIPARVRWISAEPLLGPLPELDLEGFHWIVVGGESGPGRREMDQTWVRQIRDMAKTAGVAFYFKQSAGARAGQGDLLDGRRWREFPVIPAVDEQKENDRVQGEGQTNRAFEQGQQGVQTEESKEPEHLDPKPERSEILADSMTGKAGADAALSVTWKQRPIQTAAGDDQCQVEGCPVRRQEKERQPQETECSRAEEQKRQDEEPLCIEQENQREIEQLRTDQEHCEDERQRQQQEIASLRAELEREQTDSERFLTNSESMYEREREKRQKAEEAAVRWQQLADEAQRGAERAWQACQYVYALGFNDALEVHHALTVLGLQWPCTFEEVKKAYRQLAMKFHPDRNPGDKEAEIKFLEVQAANDQLNRILCQGEHDDGCSRRSRGLCGAPFLRIRDEGGMTLFRNCC